MNLAIVCDDLIQFGGAERIVEEFSDMFPEAPIYTSVASKAWLQKYQKKGRVVKTSFLQKFPLAVKLNRYYAPFFLQELGFESFDFSIFDVVLSSSTRFAHHIITRPTTKHICYMHSPGRMFWEPQEYFENENFGFLKPLKNLATTFLKIPLLYIRILDYSAAKKVDNFIANSIFTQKKIKKYYNRDSDIVYPYIDNKSFKGVKSTEGNYFLVVTRLLSWKKVDIAIEACKKLDVKLKIMGEGPDEQRLKSISDDHIEFLGYLGDREKMKIMEECRALIVTQKEDFGIAPLEVMACGKPVIAYKAGGVLESVIDGVTGEFFQEQSAKSLEEVLQYFDSEKYLFSDCKKRAQGFDVETFRQRIREKVKV